MYGSFSIFLKCYLSWSMICNISSLLVFSAIEQGRCFMVENFLKIYDNKVRVFESNN